MVQPSTTTTFGAIDTTHCGEVVAGDGAVVPGLFAAGADVGGLSNHGYLGVLAPGYITDQWTGTGAASYPKSVNRVWPSRCGLPPSLMTATKHTRR
jgi:hypothetical protein